MPLQSGTTLGVYEILAPLGAGGMGEVYKARDSKLGRFVALKVLPDGLASDRDRTARFEREAKLLASIHHPHIASLFGLEESAGRHFLVMELVEGEDLAARIARGPMSLDSALPIARQIAEALDAAHDKGIVHRDLKPTNIRITTDGSVKVLDFGLAKSAGQLSPLEVSARPTALGDATQAGTVLGTAAYMAPEQAQGKPVDKRADIWAFGVVLSEMLTGQSPFRCETLAETLAAVLTKEPDWSRVPARVQPLLRRCLAKNPRERLRDIGDVPLLLNGVEPATRQSSMVARATPWVIAAAVSVVALAATFWMSRVGGGGSNDESVMRWTLNMDIANPGNGFGISRDGRRVAYPAAGDARQRIWIRELNQLEPQPVAGTEGGKRPFFSPDGQWFAFFTGTARLGHLNKVPVAGGSLNTRGSVTMLCENANLYGASWSDDDQIIFSGPSGLMRVTASGGPCEPLSRSDPKEGDHRWPQMLPGGASVLFTIGIEGAFDSAHIAVLDLKTGKYRTVLDGGADARYVPSGHLVFVRGGQMFAAPFDLARLAVTGTPQVVVDSIFHVNAGGYAAYAVSETGTLLYLTQRVEGFEWRDRTGNVTPVTTPPGLYRFFRLSPDGTRVVVQHGGQGDIEIISLERGVAERVTTEGMNNTPIWSRDGHSVTFATMGKGIYQASLDGRTGVRALQESIVGSAPWDWTPDGHTLVYERDDPLQIWTLDVSEGHSPGVPHQLLGAARTAFFHPAISPDGQWFAYVSNESGQPQVNVQAFPGLGGKVMISRDGGEEPRWSRDGRELFYLSPRNEIMVVEVRTGVRFNAGTPKVLMASGGNFDVDSTGQRFLVLKQQRSEQLQAVMHWFEELKHRFVVK